MTKTKATPRSSAKKSVDLVRQGKTLTSLLTVYERILSGEIAWNQADTESLKLSIAGKSKEISDTVLGLQQ